MTEINTDQIKHFWDCINPKNKNHVFQCFFKSTSKKSSGILHTDNIDQIIEWCKKFHGWGLCCLSINPIEKGKTNTEGVTDLENIWIDIDVKDERKVNGVSTEGDKQHALDIARKSIQKLEEIGFGVSLFIDSGNGFHIYVPVSIPLNGVNENKSQWDSSEIKGKLITIEKTVQQFNDDIAHIDGISKDIFRRAKIPGTLNVKKEIPEEKYRMCTIIEIHIPDETVISKNTELFNSLKPTKQEVSPIAESIPDKLEYAITNDKTFRELFMGEWKKYCFSEDGSKKEKWSRSEAEMKVISMMFSKHGFTEHDVRNAMSQCRIGKWNEAGRSYQDLTIKKVKRWLKLEDHGLTEEEQIEKLMHEKGLDREEAWKIVQDRKEQVFVKRRWEEQSKEAAIVLNKDKFEEIQQQEITDTLPECYDEINETGFIGFYTYYQNLRTNAPSQYGVHFCIQLMGQAVGRKTMNYIQPFAVRHNTYLCLIGESGTSKKTTSQDLAKRCCNQTKILPVDSFSPEGLLKALSYQPGGLAFNGEFSVLLRGIQGQGYLASYKEISNELHRSPDKYERTLSKSKDSFVIEGVYLSQSTTCTPIQFFSNVTEQAVYEGFLPRWIFIPGNAKYRQRQPLPKEAALYEHAIRTTMIRIEDLFLKNDIQFVFTEDALNRFNEIDQELQQDSKWIKVQPFVVRYAEYIITYADMIFLSDLIHCIGINEFLNIEDFDEIIVLTQKKRTGDSIEENKSLDDLKGLDGSEGLEGLDSNLNMMEYPSVVEKNQNRRKSKKSSKPSKSINLFDCISKTDDNRIVLSVPAEYVDRAWIIFQPCLEFTRTIVKYVSEDQKISKVENVLSRHAPIFRSSLMTFVGMKKRELDECIDTLKERETIFLLQFLPETSRSGTPKTLYCKREYIDSDKCGSCSFKGFCTEEKRQPHLTAIPRKVLSEKLRVTKTTVPFSPPKLDEEAIPVIEIETTPQPTFVPKEIKEQRILDQLTLDDSVGDYIQEVVDFIQENYQCMDDNILCNEIKREIFSRYSLDISDEKLQQLVKETVSFILQIIEDANSPSLTDVQLAVFKGTVKFYKTANVHIVKKLLISKGGVQDEAEAEAVIEIAVKQGLVRRIKDNTALEWIG